MAAGGLALSNGHEYGIDVRKFLHLSHRERSDRIDRCDPGEGFRSIDRPHPLIPTLSPWERECTYAVASSQLNISNDTFAYGTRSNMTAALRFDPIRLPPEC